MVWGDSSFGLKHILEKHPDDFISFGEGEQGLINALSEIIENGKLVSENGVNTIWYKKDDDIYKIGLSKGFHKEGDNNWIVTGYQTNREKDKTFGDALFTDKQPLPNSDENSTTPLHKWQEDLIKQGKSEQYVKDLEAWHKDSSPLTKNEDGSPKVFYHGTTKHKIKRANDFKDKEGEAFEVFETKNNKGSQFSIGSWFSNDKGLAKNYTDSNDANENIVYEVFLKAKKPFIMEKELSAEKMSGIDKMFKLTGQDKKRGLKALERFRNAKAELNENGFEFLDYWGEEIFIKHIKSGKEFRLNQNDLSKKNLREKIESYEARLKENDLDRDFYEKELKELKELKEFQPLLKHDLNNTLDFYDYYSKEYFKNETELYILVSARDNRAINSAIKKHYGYDRGMYMSARIYPLQQYYKEAGYDGIQFNEREFVVFDSNQIKSIDNIGSYVDSKGEFIKATEAEAKKAGQKHSYFNESSPNIMHSNAHLGAGLVSGGVAGVETDENGNIVGFNPAKFAMGFLGGASASLAVKKGLEIKARSVAKNYSNIAKDNPALLSEIVKRDLNHYARTNIANSLTRFLNKHKELDLNPQIFAGEKALVNEAYKPQAKKLKVAKKLESSGASSLEIWENTGWYKDKDNKWKFEISQKGGELQTKDDYGRAYKKEWLPIILKDDELFSAYPSLQYIRVLEDKKLGAGVGGAYDPETKNIYIKNLQAKDAKAILYHELQHAVQDIEGFGFGFKERVSSDESFDLYYKQHGEAEARNVEAKLDTDNKGKIRTYKSSIPAYKRSIAFWENEKNKSAWNGSEQPINEIRQAQANIAYNTQKIKELQDIAKIGRYTQHPHKTMDIDIKDTIAEATMQGEALSRERPIYIAEAVLESAPKMQGQEMDIQNALHDIFLHNGALDFSRVKTQELPKANFNNTKQFSNLFTNKQGKFGIIQTPYKDIKVDIAYAYRHFYQNTHNANRDSIKGAFFDTFAKPLFIAQKETDKGLSTYYYKVYDYGEGKIGIFGIGVDENGLVDFKTLYADKGNQRINHILNSEDTKVLYIDTEQLLAR